MDSNRNTTPRNNQYTDVQEWLNNYAPGYKELSERERRAIMDFAMLWSLFEAQVLNENGSANAIVSKVHEWYGRGLLAREQFEPFLRYFVERYVAEGALNSRFAHLHLRNNDHRDLVERVLLAAANNENLSLVEVAAVPLIIVWRYRNNFFHGIKWAYQMRDQFDNFNKANHLLMLALDIHRRAV